MSTIPLRYLRSREGLTLSDYHHGRRLFGDNQNELVPKFSFLYHVYFNINPAISFKPNNNKVDTVGMLVKSVDLPKFTIQTKELRAYNQTAHIQTGIKYEPVSMKFHDDSADVVREFWYNYMTWYYGDAYNKQDEYFTNQQNRYADRKSQQFGYNPRDVNNTRFLQSIKIYSLSKGKYSEYILVNPTIETWKHGEHQAGQSDFIGHDMSVKFETVLYNSGLVTDGDVSGFGLHHYDNTDHGLYNAGYALPTAVGKSSLTDSLNPAKKPGFFGGLVNKLGRLAVNTAVSAASNKLRNTKFGNGFGGVIAESAANAAFSSAASAIGNKTNQVFPSIGKTFIQNGTSSANSTAQGFSSATHQDT